MGNMNRNVLTVVGITLRVGIGLALMAGGIAMMVYSVSVLRVHPAGSIDWLHGVSASLIPMGIGGFVAVGGPSKRKSS